MPKLFSHLYVGEKILEKNSRTVNNISQYYLGLLCPDALYNDETFARQKKISHLYENMDRENTKKFINAWKNNVNKFYTQNKLNDNLDFLIGYCIHILSDIFYYNKIQPILKKEYLNDIELLQNEYSFIEYQYFLENKYVEKMIPKINEFVEFDFLNIISKNDMKRLKIDTIDFLSGKYNKKMTTYQNIYQ